MKPSEPEFDKAKSAQRDKAVSEIELALLCKMWPKATDFASTPVSRGYAEAAYEAAERHFQRVADAGDVERIARALAGLYWKQEVENESAWAENSYIDSYWKDFVDEAKAAIAALRTTTPDVNDINVANIGQPSETAGLHTAVNSTQKGVTVEASKIFEHGYDAGWQDNEDGKSHVDARIQRLWKALESRLAQGGV